MRGILAFMGMSVGGAVGWWLGALHGPVLATLVSAVGTGAGLYLVRWLAREYLE